MARTVTFTDDAEVNKVCLEKLAGGGLQVEIHFIQRRYDVNGKVIEELPGQTDFPIVGVDISQATFNAVKAAILAMIQAWKDRRYS